MEYGTTVHAVELPSIGYGWILCQFMITSLSVHAGKHQSTCVSPTVSPTHLLKIIVGVNIFPLMLTADNVCVCVKFCCKLGKNFTETFQLLNQAYGEHCMS